MSYIGRGQVLSYIGLGYVLSYIGWGQVLSYIGWSQVLSYIGWGQVLTLVALQLQSSSEANLLSSEGGYRRGGRGSKLTGSQMSLLSRQSRRSRQNGAIFNQVTSQLLSHKLYTLINVECEIQIIRLVIVQF